MSSRRQYPFDLIEPKWQQRWDAEQTFRALAEHRLLEQVTPEIQKGAKNEAHGCHCGGAMS